MGPSGVEEIGDVKGKTVLVRADFHVENVLSTIKLLIKKQARIVVVSGRGDSLTLKTMAEELARDLQRKCVAVGQQGRLPEYSIPHVFFFEQNIEQVNLRPYFAQMRPGDVAVLENLRIYPGEEKGEERFAKLLSQLAEIYVNECFAASHHNYASITGVPKFLPGFMGLHFSKELSALTSVRNYAHRPVVVMMGGMKIADKARTLLHIGRWADVILLGGGMAALILEVRGFQIGKSLKSQRLSRSDERETALLGKELWRDYKDKIKLPLDVVVSSSEEGQPESVPSTQIKASQMILDIGPQTIRAYSEYLKKGRTLIWSGPLGMAEKKPFSHGTYALARVFAAKTKKSVFGAAGGGQTAEVLAKAGLLNYVDHVAPSGGAMLEFLARGTLPGIKALT